MGKSKFLVGLIGEGIQASLSPALHEEEAGVRDSVWTTS